MLELAIMGLLKEHPMHGYDLRKRLRSGFGLLASLSFGSLYPALARLERAGAVREVRPPDDAPTGPIPLTGSLSGERAAFRARLRAKAASHSPAGGRARRVFELTEAGEQSFAALLSGEEGWRRDDDTSFALRWSFAHYLSEDARVRLLERQHRRLEERAAGVRKRLAELGGPGDRFGRQLAEHSLDTLVRDIGWIDSLMASERAGAAAHGDGNGAVTASRTAS